MKAEVFALREVCLSFPPVFSHLTISVLTNGDIDKHREYTNSVVHGDEEGLGSREGRVVANALPGE